MDNLDKKTDQYSKEHTCEYCNANVRVTVNDLIKESSTITFYDKDRKPFNETSVWYALQCPECKTRTHSINEGTTEEMKEMIASLFQNSTEEEKKNIQEIWEWLE